MRLRPDCLVLDAEGGPVLWPRRTGRAFSLRPEALRALLDWPDGLPPSASLRPLVTRLAEQGMLADGPDLDLAALIPARSRRVLLLPARPALWHPRPFVREAGGHAFAALPLDEAELRLWRAMNGARRLREVAAQAGVSPDRALAFLERLTDPDVQAASLWPTPPRAREPALARLVTAPRPAAPREEGQWAEDGGTELSAWHTEIPAAEGHFDEVETTLAHAFALPHPALDGLPYGAALHAALESRGLLPEDGPMLEVGPGTGELGAAFLERVRQRGLPRGEFLRLDASPALLAAQERHLPGTRGLRGEATAIPLPDRSLGFVLCNEVIADLAAVPYDPRDPSPGPCAAEVKARLQRHGIAPLPGERPLYNLGAWLFVEELARVLRPGGTAILTEFGGPDEAPEETRFLGHPEVSIHFGHLYQVARGLGLQAGLLPLPDLLEMDLSARWLSRPSYEALRALARSRGERLPARAWRVETLALPEPVEGLYEVPVHEEGPGPVPTRFQALWLRR